MNKDNDTLIGIAFLVVLVDIISIIEICTNPNAISFVEFLGQYIHNGFFYLTSILGGICLSSGIAHAIKVKKWTKESTGYALTTILIIVSSALVFYSTNQP